MNFINQIEPYITDNEIRAVSEYLKSGGWLTEFKKTEEFEKMLANFLGTKYAVVLTSGTVALYLALLALRIGRGDKVIVPNYTMIATINAVKWTGAEPVIADVDPANLCLDITKIKLDPACKAMIYVSINGRSSDMDGVRRFCREKKLALIEDACQAFGSKCGGKYLGTFGLAGAISFTPHKIITTGQGGAVVTDNEEVCQKVRKLKDFCRVSPGVDVHEDIGFNFKFTDLQAVIGIEQMKAIAFRIEQKKKIFGVYRQELSGVREVEFLSTDLNQTVPWFVDILLPADQVRDSLAAHLKKQNIGVRVFYPPLNHQAPYSHFTKGTFPVSESVVNRGLWLPSSISLDSEKIGYICAQIKDFFSKGRLK